MVPVGVCAMALPPRKAIAIRQTNQRSCFILPPELSLCAGVAKGRGFELGLPVFCIRLMIAVPSKVVPGNAIIDQTSILAVNYLCQVLFFWPLLFEASGKVCYKWDRYHRSRLV